MSLSISENEIEKKENKAKKYLYAAYSAGKVWKNVASNTGAWLDIKGRGIGMYHCMMFDELEKVMRWVIKHQKIVTGAKISVDKESVKINAGNWVKIKYSAYDNAGKAVKVTAVSSNTKAAKVSVLSKSQLKTIKKH